MSFFNGMCALSLVGILTASVANAKDSKLRINTQESDIEFKAIGNPSALVVLGKGQGIEGGMVFSEGGSVNGQVIVDLTTLTTGLSLRDKHLKNKYLEVGTFKTAEFSLQKIQWKSAESAMNQPIVEQEFSGIMKIKNVEKVVAGVVSSVPGKDKVNATFKFTILLEDFAITIPSFAGITMAKDVEITANIVLHKETTP